MSNNTQQNPYSKFYDVKYGSILGRPIPFNPKCDPSQRVYQETMLRNNTIIRFTPGVYKYDDAKMAKAEEVLNDHVEQIKKIEEKYANDPDTKLKELDKLNSDTNAKMIKDNLDLRYLVFEPAVPQFLKSLQLLINKAATSVYKRSNIGTASAFTTDLAAALDINSSVAARGFNIWVEKSTSISESVSNSFTSSVFENLLNKTGRAFREVAVAGEGVGLDTSALTGAKVQATNSEGKEKAFIERMGSITNLASSSMTGAKVILPSIWDDSKFNRSYNISFRFMSPYGDDRSIMDNVIIPFLFILTMALPRQVGVSGLGYPHLLQVDSPGYFSTPMGVIDNMSFQKGGSESLWSDSGLPLVIEGTFSIIDLYNNLSLPINNSGFVTNLGTAAFVSNLVGASMYSVLDPTISTNLANYVKGGLTAAQLPIYESVDRINSLARYVGIVGTEGTAISSLGDFGQGIVNSFDNLTNAAQDLFKGQ